MIAHAGSGRNLQHVQSILQLQTVACTDYRSNNILMVNQALQIN